MPLPDGLLIVPAAADDAAAIAALHARAWPEPWSDAAFRRFIGMEASIVRLASSGPNGPPAGFILALAALDEAEILMLAVAPGLRRRGIARALIAALEEEARPRGTMRIHLEVGEKNDAARALYRRLGFIETGRRKAYYRPAGAIPEDAILMAKDLR